MLLGSNNSEDLQELNDDKVSYESRVLKEYIFEDLETDDCVTIKIQDVNIFILYLKHY